MIKKSVLTLARRFGRRAGFRTSFLQSSLWFLKSLQARRACSYIYLKKTSQRLLFLPRLFVFFSNGLIIFCLAGLFLVFMPLAKVEIGSRHSQSGSKQSSLAKTHFASLLDNEIRALTIPAPDPQFSLVIPKIGVRSKIIAQVDPASERDYHLALKNGIAHGAGSSLPGMGQTVWLFGHSTDQAFNVARYNAVFFLLKNLEPKDEVIVFYDQKRFNYEVVEKQIVKGTDIDFLTNEGGERLILQTCWPPGTTLKRLIVLAEPAFQNF